MPDYFRLTQKIADITDGIPAFTKEGIIVDLPKTGSIYVEELSEGWHITSDIPVYPIPYGFTKEGIELTPEEYLESEGTLTRKERKILNDAFTGITIGEEHPHEDENTIHVHVNEYVPRSGLLSKIEQIANAQIKAIAAFEKHNRDVTQKALKVARQ